MVNIVDAFRKLENRDPTQSEVIKMMQMKAEQDARKNGLIKPKQNIAELSSKYRNQHGSKLKREPKSPQQINDDRKYKWPYRASQKAMQINRMLNDGVTIEKIAYYLDVRENVVSGEITRWDLPQKQTKK